MYTQKRYSFLLGRVLQMNDPLLENMQSHEAGQFASWLCVDQMLLLCQIEGSFIHLVFWTVKPRFIVYIRRPGEHYLYGKTVEVGGLFEMKKVAFMCMYLLNPKILASLILFPLSLAQLLSRHPPCLSFV